MNLRKDHSHMFQQQNCESFCGLLCDGASGSSCDCSRVVGRIFVPTAALPTVWRFGVINCFWLFASFYSQLSAMDVSARTTMKGAAKCDKHCELQNSVNRQELERILCFWDIPESMPASVSMLCCSSSSATPGTAAASACASRCTSWCS